ncbi:hypothetical protein QF004_002179 [Chryseobacterium sp. MDT2-18]|uniref:DNA polymerase IV n=1 Tax=Chryseobacterium salivictor TaxID=2547600 RepID=A0A4P6ZGW4_9FLAO|nr:hypothetical protein [Chryseobacterium sp. MDT2-18]QBO58832.1 DNA polymerase IV [Chryseobacterium salivictor]
MNRAIVHMDLDTFFVSCERLKNTELEKLPVIIGGGDRGLVASCSYEARYFGVRSAMSIKMALRLCPEAKVIKGDMEYYSNISHLVTEVIRDQAVPNCPYLSGSHIAQVCFRTLQKSISQTYENSIDWGKVHRFGRRLSSDESF